MHEWRAILRGNQMNELTTFEIDQVSGGVDIRNFKRGLMLIGIGAAALAVAPLAMGIGVAAAVGMGTAGGIAAAGGGWLITT